MAIDYVKLGFKSGLEIHQQLDTHKLFCKCPSILRNDKRDYEIERKLHTVAGESGEVDVAAKHEVSLGKDFVYQGYNDTTCLVELDEEPPQKINSEALLIALHISLLLNANVLPITQIMRKTVLDGSNTSGFQRTVMIARDGYVDTSKGRVKIEAVFLEEDSARVVERSEKKVVYKLDRLGIPLVEIATAPDIKDATHAKETALLIGEILRSCQVKRGIGTIRQDINISIEGSNRVELKGFQDPKIMEKTVEEEVKRQRDFVKKGEKNPAEVRNVLPNGKSEFLRPMPGSARMYPETDLEILKIKKELIDRAKKTLPKLRSELEREFKKQGLNAEYINLLFKQNKVNSYMEFYFNFPKPNILGELILVYPKELSKKFEKDLDEVEEKIEENLGEIIELANKKKIKEKDMKEIISNLVYGKTFEDAIKIEKVDVASIEEEIHKIIKSKPGLNPNAYMGLVMKAFNGKVDGSEAMRVIRKFAK